MSDIYIDVAAAGVVLSDRDLASKFEEAVVSLLLIGTTYQRISYLTGMAIMAVMQTAHRNGIQRSTPRTNLPATNLSTTLTSKEFCAVIGAKEVL